MMRAEISDAKLNELSERFGATFELHDPTCLVVSMSPSREDGSGEDHVLTLLISLSLTAFIKVKPYLPRYIKYVMPEMFQGNRTKLNLEHIDTTLNKRI